MLASAAWSVLRSPGGGPRSGWYGTEDWSAGAWAKRWEEYADGADTELTRAECMARHRPSYLDTDLGEQRAQHRGRKLAAGTCTMSSDGKARWRNADDEFGDTTWREMVAETAEAAVARAAADGSSWWDKVPFWNKKDATATLDGASRSDSHLANSQANPLAALADGRWDTYEAEAAKNAHAAALA